MPVRPEGIITLHSCFVLVTTYFRCNNLGKLSLQRRSSVGGNDGNLSFRRLKSTGKPADPGAEMFITNSEAFQGVEGTRDMAPKTGGNLLPKY